MYAVFNKDKKIVKHVATYEQAKKVAIQLTMVFIAPFKIAFVSDVWDLNF